MASLPPAGDDELATMIAGGAAALHTPLEGADIARLVAYLRLVERWNATYNLTAIRDVRDMVAQHVLDCLAAAAALFRRRDRPGSLRLLDVGSGAGLPGLIVAMAAPSWRVTCIDSVGKKAAFITQAAGVLGLRNVVVRHGRVEALVDRPFDVVVSRAFSSLPDFISLTHRLVAPSGLWMAMKGKPPEDELRIVPDLTFHVEPLVVPGLDSARCVVWLSEAPGATSERTPSAGAASTL